MKTFTQSQRVRLLPFEAQPAQLGIILGGSKDPWIVQLDDQYYDAKDDDGLREVTDDQLEIVSY